MQKRTLGATGLEVTLLGFGSAQLGFMDVPQRECDAILNGVLDAGINLIDTAACYKDSEEKIGRAIGGRRSEYVLVTKCGHAVEPDDPPEWSPEFIRKSVERSLRRLRTDHVDVLLIHSCPEKHLRDEALIDAIEKCKRDGLTRFIGYSGDNEAAELALRMPVFDCLETSISIADQQGIDRLLPDARERRFGVFAKRPLANTAWRDLKDYSEFYADYAEEYTRRLKLMDISPESLGFDGDWLELALRFTVYQPGLHCALVGGKNLDHVKSNIRIVEKGPLPDAVLDGLRRAWQSHDDGLWIGQT